MCLIYLAVDGDWTLIKKRKKCSPDKADFQIFSSLSHLFCLFFFFRSVVSCPAFFLLLSLERNVKLPPDFIFLIKTN